MIRLNQCNGISYWVLTQRKPEEIATETETIESIRLTLKGAMELDKGPRAMEVIH